MPESYFLPKELAVVSTVFGSFCEKAAMQVIAAAVDKHGSWEWAAVRAGGVNRLVSVALTEQADALGSPKFYAVEVWAEAETENQGRSAHRALVDSFRVNDRVIPELTFGDRLTNGLNRARERADTFRQDDLRPLMQDS